MAKYCPHCEQTYDGVDFDTCPDDGARLYRRSERPDDPLVGTVLDERFRIDAPLSEGGMGAVYLATQLSVSRQVALKVVHSDLEDDGPFVDRFFREAQVIAGLSHPNIVRLVDFGQDDHRDILYLVMELVRGTEMGEVVAKGRIDPALALDVAFQICAGLTEPHSRGIVHRDLKPANVIITPSSDGTFRVKIVDFGIARTDDGTTRLTKTGMICGTPAYLSPEQAQNMEVDQRTDLYSLGVVLFEMLTGHLPFRGPSGLQLLMEHVRRQPPRLAAAYPGTIPEPISELVWELMQKEPADRPTTAMEVRRRIQAIRRELDLAPVFIDHQPSDADDVNALVESWLRPELDLDRLDDDHLDGADDDQPPPDDDTDDTNNTEDPVDPDDDIAFADTVAGAADDSDSPNDSDGDDSDDIAFADTIANPDQSTPVTTDEDAPGEADIDDTDDEADDADNRSADPPTAPLPRGRDSRQLLIVLLLAAVIALAAVVVAIAVPFSSDSTDDADHLASQQQPADELDSPTDDADEDDAPVQRPDDPDVDVADAPKEQETAEPTPQPEQAIAQPAEQPPAPSPQPTPDQQQPVAATDDDPDQPGSARPPVPSDDSSDPDLSHQVHEGSVLLESPAQVAPVENYHEITGDLVVRITVDDYSRLQLPDLQKIRGNLVVDPHSRLTTVSLPKLEQIGGGLMLNQGDHLETLNAPSLRSIGANLLLNSTSLVSFELGELRQIGGMLHLAQNGALSRFELPALRQIGGSLSVLGNPHLKSLTLPRLTQIADELQVLSAGLTSLSLEQLGTVGAGVTFNENDSLQRLKMGNLSTVGLSSTRQAGLILNGAANLEQLDLSGLRQINGNLTINALSRLTDLNLESLREVEDQLIVTDNGAVETIDLTTLTSVGGNLLITGHPALEELVLPRLRHVDDLQIINSPRLDACDIHRHVDDMKENGWSGDARLVNVDDDHC